MTSFTSLGMLVLANLVPQQNPPRRETLPFAVDDVLAQRTFSWSPVALCPSGTWVGYSLNDPRRIEALADTAPLFSTSGVPYSAVGTEQWVSNTDMGVSKNLSGNVGVSWGGTWSPDCRYLAFYSDRTGVAQIWLWNVTTGRTRRVSTAAVRPFNPSEVVHWTPDGANLVVKLAPDRPAAGLEVSRSTSRVKAGSARGHRILVYRSERQDTLGVESPDRKQTAPWVADLAVVAVANGEVRRLVRNKPIASYFVSPAGDLVAYTLLHGFAALSSQDNRVDIVVAGLKDGQERTSIRDVFMGLLGRGVSWSPDGSALAYCISTLSRNVKHDCFVVPPSGGVPRLITPGRHPQFDTSLQSPLWEPSGRAIYLLGHDTLWRAGVADGKLTAHASIPGRSLLALVASAVGAEIWSPGRSASIFMRIRDPKTWRAGIGRVELATGQATVVFEEDIGDLIEDFYSFAGVDARGDVAVYVAECVSGPPDLWIARDGFAQRRRLTRINPHLDKYSFGSSRIVEWLNLDGKPLRGVLLLPVGYKPGSRYPLVVWVYGGRDLTRYVNKFGLWPNVYNMQLLATRGFAVFLPDAPQEGEAPMLELGKAILAGVNRVAELGVADLDRIGVAGYSYGGYSTLALLVQTHRFKAGVAVAGFGNLITMYGMLDESGYSFGTGWAETGQGAMRGTPWERRERFIENSPFFYLDRVDTPLLLMHGTADLISSVNADQVFSGLRRLGKEVVYAKYEGVGHTFMLAPLPQQRDYYERIINWFEQHLMNHAPATP